MNAPMVDRMAAALACLVESTTSLGDGTQTRLDVESARAALAAYDAERPRVESAHVAHYANGKSVHAAGAGWEMDTHMPADLKSPAATLRDYADEEDARAARSMKRAARMRAIADCLERQA